MAEKQTEVNDVEKVEVESSEPEEGEEVITKPEDIEETETPSDSSAEEKPDEATEGKEGEEGEEKEEKLVTHKEPSEPEEDKGIVETSEDGIGDEIKKLPNETPREFALRLEVTRLKRGNREKRTKDLLSDGEKEKSPAITNVQYNELSEDEKSLLSEYDPKELKTFEKILDVLAKKHGWVKKDELDSTTKSQIFDDIFDDFLESHPEYLPENDKDNVLWNRFKEEYTQYKTPDNSKDLKKRLNKAHQDVFGIQSNDGLKKIKAQKEKLKVVSHSGGSVSRGQSSSEETRLTPEQKSHLKGFSDKDFEELDL